VEAKVETAVVDLAEVAATAMVVAATAAAGLAQVARAVPGVVLATAPQSTWLGPHCK